MNVAIVTCYIFHDYNYSLIYITVFHLYFSVRENQKSFEKKQTTLQ